MSPSTCKLVPAALIRLALESTFFDYDSDGDADLYVANGHIDEDIERFDPQATYAQRDQLYRNEGNGRFSDISEQGPALHSRAWDAVLPWRITITMETSTSLSSIQSRLCCCAMRCGSGSLAEHRAAKGGRAIETLTVRAWKFGLALEVGCAKSAAHRVISPERSPSPFWSG